jgi:hypothetical protein
MIYPDLHTQVSFTGTALKSLQAKHLFRSHFWHSGLHRVRQVSPANPGLHSQIPLMHFPAPEQASLQGTLSQSTLELGQVRLP